MKVIRRRMIATLRVTATEKEVREVTLLETVDCENCEKLRDPGATSDFILTSLDNNLL